MFRPHEDTIERSIAVAKEREMKDLETILNVYPAYSAYKRFHNDLDDAHRKDLISKICGRSVMDDSDDVAVEHCWSQTKKAGTAVSIVRE